MKIKFIFTVIGILLVSMGPVFAGQGHDHGTTHHKEGVSQLKGLEVGNKICPVSGEQVGGDMGDPVKIEYNGKIYNLCCKMCAKDFKKDPEKYSKIAEEEAMDDHDGTMGHHGMGHEHSHEE